MIPTAEEFINKNSLEFLARPQNLLKKFAKLHVEAALKEASLKAKVTTIWEGNTGSEYMDFDVDRNSILNAYPLKNIK